MKKERTLGVYLVIAGAIVAAVAAILYRGVMYKYQPVYFFLIGTIILAACMWALATVSPMISGLIPVVNAALMASAVVWGTSLMVNQIGYVYAGLDGVDTIMGYIIFVIFAVIGMIMNILAAFLPVVRVNEES
ncbi:MAG TPA: hypothetical protein DHV42_05460 [Lachnospiraceae bacterium]|nr:hypothetical protein [Lachnospiraceae bacterium]